MIYDAIIYSDWQGAGGSIVGRMPPSHFEVLQTTDRTTRDDDGTLVVSAAAPAYSLLTDGVVIQLRSDYESRDYRLHVMRDSSTEDRLTASLRSPLYELQYAGVCNETSGTTVSVALSWKALSPSSVVTKILTFCPAWWSAGTITPTIPVDLEPSGWTPLKALRELVSAIRAQGVSCELTYERVEPTGYYTVSLVTAIGSSAATLDVRTAKNLVSLNRTRDRERYGVEAVGVGTGSPPATIGPAWWACTGKSTNVLTMAQPVTGGAMLAFDDQLNTSRYMIDDTGARQQITDCVAGGTQTVTVASGTNFTVGRWYRAAYDSAGTEFLGLRRAAGTTGPVQIVSASDLTADTNFVDNPAMRVWTGSSTTAPDGWTNNLGAVLNKTTTVGLWVYGGQSCKVGTGDYLQSPPITVYVPSYATTATWSAWIKMTAVAGSPTVEFYKDGSLVTSVDVSGYAANTWHRVDHSASITTGTTHYFAARVNASAATMYYDSAQVTLSSSAVDFCEGSNPAKLWARCNAYLTTYSGSVPTSYEATFADLNLIDSAGFPYDEAELGQTANVTDTRLGITTSGRIVELRRDWLRPEHSTLTISHKPDDLVTLLSGIQSA